MCLKFKDTEQRYFTQYPHQIPHPPLLPEIAQTKDFLRISLELDSIDFAYIVQDAINKIHTLTGNFCGKYHLIASRIS